MGDFADMYDYLLDDWEDGGEEWTGRCAPQPKTCMRCGTKGLWWGTLGDGNWFLATSRGERHQCPPASPDEFD